jgi:3-hydroxyisobutyrate dehydrogenase-like beta-hydroxyacid dehydrogenase
MSKIAFLGLGSMGSRMAARLIAAGQEVVVWNRTPEKAIPLAALGAAVADSPRAAATGAGFVISMVRDDDASQAVWLDEQNGALAALAPDAIGLECSTLSLPFVRSLADAFEQAGRVVVDAPLAGSRPQAEAGQLIFLVGGTEVEFERVQPILAPMAGAVHHAGDTGSGATLKLMVNALFGAQLAVVAELIGFAESASIDVARAVEIIGSTPVCSPAAKVAAEAMIASTWSPAFPIELVAKDFAHLEQSAITVSADTPVSQRAGEVYRAGADKGLGNDNITGIVQLYRLSQQDDEG